MATLYIRNTSLPKTSQEEIDSNLEALQKCINCGDFFELEYAGFLTLIYDAFTTEIEYLKTAYVANTLSPQNLERPSPSQILFKKRYPEIDRTLTGVLALRLIHNMDYDGFTRAQPSGMKMTKESFYKLCNFFRETLGDFRASSKIVTLIALQVTNDLGKSAELKYRVSESSAGRLDVNHDMLLHQALTYHPELVPSIQTLDNDGTIRSLIALSSEYNPGQLTQGESMPALLEAVQVADKSVDKFRLKFMETFLDVSGALGHVDHDGSITMTDPVFKTYDHAREVSERVLQGGGTIDAWKEVLHVRLQILKQSAWHVADDWDVYSNEQHLAKARLLCMARAANDDTANSINEAFDHYLDPIDQERLVERLNIVGQIDDAAVLPTYMPEMFSLIFKELSQRDTRIQLQGLSALMSYLSRVLYVTKSDLIRIPRGVVVFERDVKEILKPIISSKEFQVDPWSVLNYHTRLPPLQILRRYAV